ncbi:5-formyltetrahydrofolate cyclo-ligase [Lactobacillus pentosus] [Lactiplantibacillus mudanjiangensis]|uniref:5-formyltetrahydrofolate cyclo-ligase n=1 Tax=Lactiplantibacillus mudanjiangensis TaxID=1296538 RepID=UPI0010148CC5|nr:5-formyltetrahydrofolate cyclo-ligase [Lactobacillus pentosus] [Lactiplantibacillus mudanjiangensis]
MIDKKAFRKQQIERLSQMTTTVRQSQLMSLQQQLLASSAWQQAKVVAMTISSDIEVDTAPLIKAAWDAGKQVVIPQTLPHRQMAFKPYTATSRLERTAFGILEPADGPIIDKSAIDLILVPGLGYSRDQHARIGFGGGYYDRYLADYPGVKLTLAYQIMAFDHAEWPVDEYDVLLDELIVAEDGVNNGR